jgi:hypothetical protein
MWGSIYTSIYVLELIDLHDFNQNKALRELWKTTAIVEHFSRPFAIIKTTHETKSSCSRRGFRTTSCMLGDYLYCSRVQKKEFRRWFQSSKKPRTFERSPSTFIDFNKSYNPTRLSQIEKFSTFELNSQAILRWDWSSCAFFISQCRLLIAHLFQTKYSFFVLVEVVQIN